jgi:RNA polymerase sigma-70 factor (ECF subfamily)
VPENDGRESELDPLVRAAQRGERAALERLLRAVYPQVLRWSRGHLRDAADAEDLTQDVLIRTVQSLHTFDGRSLFTTWLYRVVRRAAADLHRKRHRRQRLCDANLHLHQATSHVSAAVHGAFAPDNPHERSLRPLPKDRGAPHDDVAQTVEGKTEIGVRVALPHDSRLRDAFHTLPARQREVLALVDLEGWPATVVAERLGIAPATVRVHLLRARRALRSWILDRHPELVEELHGLPHHA